MKDNKCPLVKVSPHLPIPPPPCQTGAILFTAPPTGKTLAQRPVMALCTWKDVLHDIMSNIEICCILPTLSILYNWALFMISFAHYS